MKKFNWGWGIGIFYTTFVVFMLGLVWMTGKLQVEMVTPDYYKKELAYQSHIDKVNNTNRLKQQLKWQTDNKDVLLKFPGEVDGKKVEAEVVFYRPGDSSKDFTLQVSPTTDGTCKLMSDKFVKGVYHMQIDWTANGVQYYNEGVININ